MNREKTNDLRKKVDQAIEAVVKLKQALEKLEQDDDMARATQLTGANSKEPTYIRAKNSNAYTAYNPKYGDERLCVCGHLYERHFDSYDNMENVGCKYCECTEFIDANEL